MRRAVARALRGPLVSWEVLGAGLSGGTAPMAETKHVGANLILGMEGPRDAGAMNGVGKAICDGSERPGVESRVPIILFSDGAPGFPRALGQGIHGWQRQNTVGSS